MAKLVNKRQRVYQFLFMYNMVERASFFGVFVNFCCSVVTLVNFSSNYSDFEKKLNEIQKNPEKSKNLIKSPKKSGKIQQIRKSPKTTEKLL